MAYRAKKRKITGRFILILITIISLTWVSLYKISSSNKYNPKLENVNITINCGGFFVWDENVCNFNSDSVAEYYVVNGQTVNKDDKIVGIFKETSGKDIKYKTNQLEIDIYQEQMSVLQNDSSINDLNYQIQSLLLETQKNIENGIDVKEIYSQAILLKENYAKRNEFLETHSNTTDKLLQLYNEYEQWQNKLDNEVQKLIATSSGSVFFSVDGFEEKYQIKEIKDIKTIPPEEWVQNRLNNETEIKSEIIPQSYKIVNMEKCYYVTRIVGEYVPIQGTDVNIYSPAINGVGIKARVFDVKKLTDSEYAVKLEIMNPPTTIVGERFEEINIVYSNQGMFIPKKFIKNENGMSVNVLGADRAVEKVEITPILSTERGIYLYQQENPQITTNIKLKKQE